MTLPPNVLEELVADVAERIATRVLAGLELPAPAGEEPWRLADVEEVAARLGRSKRWVHGAVKERGLPFIRLDGGALAFDLDDVRAWARDRRVPAAEPEALAGRWQGGRNGAPEDGSRTRTRTVMQKAGPA